MQQSSDLYSRGGLASGARYTNFQPQDNTKYASRSDAYPPRYAPRPQPTAPPAYQVPRYDVRADYAAPIYGDEGWKMKRAGHQARPLETNQPSLWSMTADQLGSPAAYFASPIDVKRALSVAGEFTWHYFHLMQTQPEMLHCFYCRDSQLAHGSSVWPHENWHRAIGEAEIGQLFEQILKSQLEQQGSVIIRSNVKTLEAQPTRDDGIVMQATGIIETRDMGGRPFAHTIVMKKTQDAGSYVVLHDIFVFLDDINQAPVASQPAFVPSEVSAPSPDYPPTRTPAVTETPGVDITPMMPIPTGQILQSSSPLAEETTNPVHPFNEKMADESIEGQSQPNAQVIPPVARETDSAEPVVTEAAGLETKPEIDEEDADLEERKEADSEGDEVQAQIPAEIIQELKRPIDEMLPQDTALGEPETETTKEERSEGPEKFAREQISPWKAIPRQAENGPDDSSRLEVDEAVTKAEPKMALTLDAHSYAGKVLQGMRAAPAKRGVVLKRRDETTAVAGDDSANSGCQMASKTVWVSQMDGVSDAQIENAVMYRLRGCPVEGRVIRIERMRNGPAGVIELDSPECVPLLLERGLCINGRDVRVDLYKQSPSQISREPKSAPRDRRDAPRSAVRAGKGAAPGAAAGASAPTAPASASPGAAVPGGGNTANRNWQRRGPPNSIQKPQRTRKQSAEVEDGWEVAQRRKGSSRVAVARN